MITVLAALEHGPGERLRLSPRLDFAEAEAQAVSTTRATTAAVDTLHPATMADDTHVSGERLALTLLDPQPDHVVLSCPLPMNLLLRQVTARLRDHGVTVTVEPALDPLREIAAISTWSSAQGLPRTYSPSPYRTGVLSPDRAVPLGVRARWRVGHADRAVARAVPEILADLDFLADRLSPDSEIPLLDPAPDTVLLEALRNRAARALPVKAVIPLAEMAEHDVEALAQAGLARLQLICRCTEQEPLLLRTVLARASSAGLAVRTVARLRAAGAAELAALRELLATDPSIDVVMSPSAARSVEASGLVAAGPPHSHLAKTLRERSWSCRIRAVEELSARRATDHLDRVVSEDHARAPEADGPGGRTRTRITPRHDVADADGPPYGIVLDSGRYGEEADVELDVPTVLSLDRGEDLRALLDDVDDAWDHGRLATRLFHPLSVIAAEARSPRLERVLSAKALVRELATAQPDLLTPDGLSALRVSGLGGPLFHDRESSEGWPAGTALALHRERAYLRAGGNRRLISVGLGLAQVIEVMFDLGDEAAAQLASTDRSGSGRSHEIVLRTLAFLKTHSVLVGSARDGGAA
ncbi:hypothetical protein [Nonomuraea sp. NPDC052265]|uniref:hypothetical protein n=1 Tax=Nonomuraea sp. NPDC052265 TaxID=3364374 RepID=UPI0037C66580